jgi:pullulanase
LQLRKAHPAFRMTTARQVSSHIRFLDMPAGVVAYTIDGAAVNDSWKKILVVLNGNAGGIDLDLPAGEWRVAFGPSHAGRQMSKVLKTEGYSCYILRL